MFEVGQQWCYRAPIEIAQSRLVIGAILAFADDTRIICVCVNEAVQTAPDGSTTVVALPFLPLTEAALTATVTAPDGHGEVAAQFAEQFEAWREDARGLSYFTVPFEGSLDRMIARQMSEIVQTNAGQAAE